MNCGGSAQQQCNRPGHLQKEKQTRTDYFEIKCLKLNIFSSLFLWGVMIGSFSSEGCKTDMVYTIKI